MKWEVKGNSQTLILMSIICSQLLSRIQNSLSLWTTTTTIWNINPVNHQSNMPIKGRSLTAYLTLWSQSMLVHLTKKTQQVRKGHKKIIKIITHKIVGSKISLKLTKPTAYNVFFFFFTLNRLLKSSVGILLEWFFFRYRDQHGEFILMVNTATEWSKKDQLRSHSGPKSVEYASFNRV